MVLALTDIPRVKSVAWVGTAANPWLLDIVFADGADARVDMAGVVARLKAFAPLRDPDAFGRVRVVHRGGGIGWTDEIDYSAGALAILADAQRAMTGADFRRWMAHHGLSNAEAADVLGVTPRTITSYKASPRKRLPQHMKLVCHAMDREPILICAHLSPRRPGRPAKAGPKRG